MKSRFLSIALALCAVFGTARADIIINSVQDFSAVQGANGWQYGYQAGVDGTMGDYAFGSFQQMTVYDTSSIDDLGEPVWSQSGWISTSHAPSGTYVDNNSTYAIRRWTAAESGTLNLNLAAENLPLFGEAMLVSVAMNGSMLSTVTLAEGEVFGYDFLNQMITAGDTIDILFGSDSGNAALATFSGVGLLQSLPPEPAAVPEPTTWLLITAASVGYGVWARRRMPSAHSEDSGEKSAV